MKKILSLILIALMMFTVLFVSVSCKEEPEQQTTPARKASPAPVVLTTSPGSAGKSHSSAALRQ